MGTHAPPQRAEISVRKSITNRELQITKASRTIIKINWTACFSLFLFCTFCVLSAEKISAQNLSPAEIEAQAARLSSKDDETRRDALHKLRASGSESAARIATGGLDDKKEIVRATAPFSVLSLASDEAAENLLPQLKDKSEYVRRETAYALGVTRSTRAVQPLLIALQKDKKYSVKCSAAIALGEIGDTAAIDALTQILQKSAKEDEEFLRRAAARSVGQIAETVLAKEFFGQTAVNDFAIYERENRKFLIEKYPSLRRSVAALIKTLQNPKEADDPKREAAFALGAIGDAPAISVLQTKLAVEDYYLIEIARRSLQKIVPSTNPQN